MIIIIKGIYEKAFILWLYDKIKLQILAKLYSDKLIKINKFLTNIVDMTAEDIILLAINNLSCHTQDNDMYLSINDNIVVNGIPLINLCKLINYGNLSCTGYPIFSNVFKYIESNIFSLYNIYTMEKDSK